MSKLILVLCLLAAATFVASIDTEEFDSGNMKAAGASRALRLKRGWFCWKTMENDCCNDGCSGDGCWGFMCNACC